MGQSLLKLTLDLWEITDDYGSEPLSPHEWAKRYKKGVSFESAMRSWERLKARCRQSPYPVEFVPCLVRNVVKDRGDTGTAEISNVYWSMKGIAIRLPRGARASLTKILDSQNEVNL